MAEYGEGNRAEAYIPRAHTIHATVEEYLRTAYSPDREYRDGVVLERNVGDKEHSKIQARLAQYFANRRRQWNIEVYTELRVQVTPTWYPLPDVCVYSPDFEGSYPAQPPLLWIEILSPSDTMAEIWKKTGDLVQAGVPRVWIIDPSSLESELRTSTGIYQLINKTLLIPDTPIEVSLLDVVKD